MDTPKTDLSASEPPELSEEQLRKRYEDAEIERYTRIFSTYVTEIKSFGVQDQSKPPLSTAHSRDSSAAVGAANNATSHAGEDSLSATIAERYVAPRLPNSQSEIPPFTLARVRLTVNRLYLIAQVQWPRLKAAVDLALWTDYRRSLTGCLTYWFLWWFNLILPAILLYILVGLLRRGIYPYPSLADLKEHNRRIQEADEFSDNVSDKMSPSSTLDIKELYRLYRLANSDWKKTFRKHKPSTSAPSLGALNSSVRASRTSLSLSGDGTESIADTPDDATVLDDAEVTKDALELRRYALYTFMELADFYERARNIAIWRNPDVSKRYALILAGLLFATTFVPTRYLAKGTWFVIGFAFWHATPVMFALSPSDRKRIPPPFGDAPTDAEYAIRLISERVARGEDIPTFSSKKNGGNLPGAASTSKATERPWSPPRGQSKLTGLGKMIGNESLKMAKEAMKSPSLAAMPLLSGAVAIAAPSLDSNLHSFLGQLGTHNPGIITLTGKRLIFTPFVSPQTPKLDIDVGSIINVKKNGLLKGLQVCHIDPLTNTTVDEKFMWIQGRDELFARLLAFEKKKWHNV